MLYVRFQSPEPNRRGIRPGIFALGNGLAATGRLSAAERAVWRASNDWFTAHIPDPTVADPTIYLRHPDAASWFLSDASRLMTHTADLVALLAAHAIPCVEVRTDDPGRIVYRDEQQVLAIPRPA